jgi:hypothetical protein
MLRVYFAQRRWTAGRAGTRRTSAEALRNWLPPALQSGPEAHSIDVPVPLAAPEVFVQNPLLRYT